MPRVNGRWREIYAHSIWDSEKVGITSAASPWTVESGQPHRLAQLKLFKSRPWAWFSIDLDHAWGSPLHRIYGFSRGTFLPNDRIIGTVAKKLWALKDEKVMLCHVMFCCNFYLFTIAKEVGTQQSTEMLTPLFRNYCRGHLLSWSTSWEERIVQIPVLKMKYLLLIM